MPIALLWFVFIITILTKCEVGVEFRAAISCLKMPPHSLNCHKGQLHNIKYQKKKNTIVVSVLKHLSEIDSECRLDKHSAHPNPQMTHTGTHTPSRVHKLKYTHKRGRVVLRGYSGHRAWVGSESERERGKNRQRQKTQWKRTKTILL